MSFTKLKVMWAKKLLKAKFFVIMTDKESSIFFDGVDPDDFNNQLALSAQTAELEEFYEILGDLVTLHRKAVKNLNGGTSEKTTTKAKKVSRKK